MKEELKEKLSEVQNALRAPKSQHNEFGNFNYRSAEDILEAVKPLLQDNGLALTISDEIVYVGDRYYIKATVVLTDGKDEVSVSAFAREDESRPGMSESQCTGCSSSYARKYALNGLFCIDDGKDSDSFDNGSKNKPKAEAKSRKQELIDFCAEKKAEGDDENVLGKFYKFYVDKADDFKVFNIRKLYQKWCENER